MGFKLKGMNKALRLNVHGNTRTWIVSASLLASVLLLFTLALTGTLVREDRTTLLEINTVLLGGVGLVRSKPPTETPTAPEDLPLLSEDCDFTKGSWVYDDTYPLYNTSRCPFVEQAYLCHMNGRPDLSYLKLRWQPQNCRLPRFDARAFLERYRNDRIVFVGDSLSRNQFQSLLCMASEGMQDPSTMYEINGAPITKHIGFLIFKVPEFNLTLEYYRSTFLVVQGTSTKGFGNKKLSKLSIRVDEPDYRWCYAAIGAGLIVMNTGHWWNNNKVFDQGYYFQRDSRVDMNMTVEEAMPLSLQTVRKWCDENVDFNRTRVFFRGLGPAHYRRGNWLKGGLCDQYTAPLRDDELESFGPIPNNSDARQAFSGSGVEFLDISRLTMYRADAHIAYHWTPNATLRDPRKQDCSHWCLPGTPDAWNEVMYAHILRNKRVPWYSPITS